MSRRVQIVSKLKRAYIGIYKLSLSAEKTNEKHVGSDNIKRTAVLEGTASDTAQYRMSSAERVDPDRQARNCSWQVLAASPALSACQTSPIPCDLTCRMLR